MDFQPTESQLNPQNTLRIPELESSYDKEAVKRSIHELSASFEQFQDSILSAELEICLSDDYAEDYEGQSSCRV